MTTHAGKVALVTGAGRGIGQAIADAHAAAGAKVAYLDHDPELAEQAVSAARANGWSAVACAADVADFASVSAACARTEDELARSIFSSTTLAFRRRPPAARSTSGTWIRWSGGG